MTISKDGTWICSTCQDPECGGPTPQGLGDDGSLDAIVDKKPAADVIVDLLRALSSDERLNIFALFCKHCGDKNPYCHCSNDE